MALAGLSECKTLLGISGTADDAVLTLCLRHASAAIERHCRRTIEYAAADRTETYDGGAAEILLRCWPVTSVVSVKEDADGDWAGATALTADTDYRLFAERGALLRLTQGATWTEGRQTVQAVYRGGYLGPDATPVSGVSTAPTHIQEAVLLQARELWVRRREPGYKIVEGMAGGMNSGFATPVTLLEAVKELLVGERRVG